MFKITSQIVFVTMLVGVVIPGIAQERALSVAPVTAREIDDRAADRLVGAVRRIRIETANVVMKDGKAVEGARRPKAVTTYDRNGHRIDVVNYPAEENSHSGKPQFLYDDKGNIVEMKLRSDDGALLSREVYQYEFDELGNWKKMTRSIAVYENGNLGYEPIEVTYRTITYYFDQAVAKLAGTADKPARAGTPTIQKGRAGTPAIQKGRAENSRELEDNSIENHPSAALSVSRKDSLPAATISTVVEDVATKAEPAKASPPVVYVTEEALRSAATQLPQPEFPPEAEMAGIQGKVELQLLISENGEVTAVKPISGHPLLIEAAATAGRKARFSVGQLYQEPAKLFGILTYEFKLPKISSPAAEVRRFDSEETPEGREHRVEVATNNSSKTEEVTPTSSKVSAPSTNTSSSSVASANTSSLSMAPSITTSMLGTFERGLASLSSADYEAAARFFREVIQANPKDAIAYTKLGLAYSALNKPQETIDAYKKAIKLQRAFVGFDSYYRLGSAYLALEDHRSAISPLRQSLYMLRARVLNPTTQKREPGEASEAEVRYALGLAYYGSSSFRNAVKEFESAVGLKEGFASAHYGLGLSYVAVGDERAAQRQRDILKKLKSPLADKLTDQTLTPALRRSKVF